MQRMKWISRLFKYGVILAVAGALMGVGALLAAYLYLNPGLPSIEHLKDVRLQVPLRVYSRDKKFIAEFGEKRRIPLTLEEVPEPLVQAFLAAEDDRFFEHPGVDYQGLARAATQLLLTGKRQQGGSTITMQVARNFFLSREKTFVRKLNEIFLALKIERELSKREILELYLNKIYLGNRAYGVGSAAQVYYGASVHDLSLAQIAMIAGLPKAPSRFNPIANPERALVRRDYVLGRMLKLNFITPEQYETAMPEPVTATLHAPSTELDAPYVAEMARAEMVDRFGNEAYTAGYAAYTSVDSRLQRAATRALRHALLEYDRRHGYRGPEQRIPLDPQAAEADWDDLLSDKKVVGGLTPGLVTAVDDKSASVYLGEGQSIQIDWQGLSWAKPYINEDHRGAAPKTATDVLAPGDLIRIAPGTDQDGNAYWLLAQIPVVEGALVSLDPDDGAILALVGGFDFYNSKFNRATQAKRQPGSGFKAFIYSAALEAGFTAASLINDAPVVFDDSALEDAWRPENYSGKFFGPTRLRLALTKSRNLVSIRLLRAMGIKHAMHHIAGFGFDPDALPRNLSLALGSGAVTPLQMAEGYAVLANGGYHVEPYFTDRIELNQEGVVYHMDPVRVCEDCEKDTAEQAAVAATVQTPGESDTGEDELAYAPRVITAQNRYLMNSMMQDVIRHGTARRARALGRNDLAGKTGTTNDQRDAWFSGFNRSLVAVSWVGFDSSEPLGRGETGGRAALPAWISFMAEALKGVPEQRLELPDDMITVRIDPRTGERAGIDQEDAIFEVFRSEFAPKAIARTGQGLTPSAGAPFAGSDQTEDPF